MDIGINFEALFYGRLSNSMIINEFLLKHVSTKENAGKIIFLFKHDNNKVHIIINNSLFNNGSHGSSKLRILIELFLIEHNVPYDSIDFTNDNNYDLYIDTKKNSLNKPNSLFIDDKDWIDTYISIYELNPNYKILEKKQ